MISTEAVVNKLFIEIACTFVLVLLVVGCAGQRQELVCEEIEYRLSTMNYSPDQRVYMENELNACRIEEAQKKKESDKGSIYERYANTGNAASGDSAVADIPVSTLLQDSSEAKTTSIYDRYKSAGESN